MKMISKKRGKRHSTPATLVWMDEHYHLVEGVCIPRCLSCHPAHDGHEDVIREEGNKVLIIKPNIELKICDDPFSTKEFCLLQLCRLLFQKRDDSSECSIFWQGWFSKMTDKDKHGLHIQPHGPISVDF